MSSTSLICPCGSLPAFGLYSSPQGKTNPEQLIHVKNWLQMKIIDGTSLSTGAGEPPSVLVAPKLFLGPWAVVKVSAVFVFTWLRVHKCVLRSQMLYCKSCTHRGQCCSFTGSLNFDISSLLNTEAAKAHWHTAFLLLNSSGIILPTVWHCPCFVG